MTKDNALAAGQGGTEVVPAPKTGAVAPASQLPAHARTDDVYRRFAVEELALQLARGSALLARCEAIAKEEPPDQLGPIYAAARLMNANAQLAKALAQVAMVERRSRTIVETIQRPDPKIAGLNSSLPRLLENQDIRAFLERGLRLLLEQQREEQPPPEALAIVHRT